LHAKKNSLDGALTASKAVDSFVFAIREQMFAGRESGEGRFGRPAENRIACVSQRCCGAVALSAGASHL
jgi:hypothetical protein